MGIAVRDESSGRPSARAMDGSAESPVFGSEHLATSTSFRWRSVGDLFWLRFFVLTGNATTHVARVLFERVHVRRSPDRMVLVFPLKKRSNDRCLSDRGSLKTSGRSVSFRKASWQGTRWNVVVFFSGNAVRFVVRPSSPLRKRLLDRTHPGMDRSTCHSRQGSMKENGWPTPSSFSPSSFLRRKMEDLGFHVGNREA